MIEDSIALQKSQYEFLSSKISEVIADFNNVKEQVSSSTLELKQTFSELFDVKVNVIKKSVQTQISQCEQKVDLVSSSFQEYKDKSNSDFDFIKNKASSILECLDNNNHQLVDLQNANHQNLTSSLSNLANNVEETKHSLNSAQEEIKNVVSDKLTTLDKSSEIIESLLRLVAANQLLDDVERECNAKHK